MGFCLALASKKETFTYELALHLVLDVLLNWYTIEILVLETDS